MLMARRKLLVFQNCGSSVVCRTRVSADSERGTMTHLNGFGRLNKARMSLRLALSHLHCARTHLTKPVVYSVSGSITIPCSFTSLQSVYTANTDAIVIQMVSLTSQRPGHILNGRTSTKDHVPMEIYPHRRPNPKATSGKGLIPSATFLCWSSKRSGLNAIGSG